MLFVLPTLLLDAFAFPRLTQCGFAHAFMPAPPTAPLHYCPHCTTAAAAGDQTSRDAMLWSLKKCVPSFLRFELGIDLEKELLAETQAKAASAAASAASAGGAGAAAASASGASTSKEIVPFDPFAPPLSKPASLGNSAAMDGSSSDTSLEAQAVRKLIGWLDSGAAGFCDYGLEEAMQKAMAAAMDAALGRAIGTSNDGSGRKAGGNRRGSVAAAAAAGAFAAAAGAQAADAAEGIDAEGRSFVKKAAGNFNSPPRDDNDNNAGAAAAAAPAAVTDAALKAVSSTIALVDAVAGGLPALPGQASARAPPPAPPRPPIALASGAVGAAAGASTSAAAAAASTLPFAAAVPLSPMQRMDARMRAGIEVQRRAAEAERAAAAAAGKRRDALGADDAFLPGAGDGANATASAFMQRLPFIPAKIFAWHCLYTAFITNNPSFAPSLWLTFAAGWIFGFLPVIARAIAGMDAPFGSMWASYTVSAFWIVTAYQNFALTARYVAVAPLDFIRRLNIMQLLSTVIDPMSPIATEFSIPQVSSNRANHASHAMDASCRNVLHVVHATHGVLYAARKR